MTRLWLRALCVLSMLFATTAGAEILCHRDAEITPVLPKFDSRDKCLGSVKLQGISYKCGKPTEYNERMREFLDELTSNGARYCKEYCSKRAPKCYGHFEEPSKCGWSVPRSEIAHVGAEAPCADNCEGKAFLYCSIYHASYLRVEESMFADAHPNCFCDHYRK